MSEKLRKRGCRVVAATRVDDLPRIINNKKIDFVLAESSLVEMNKFELLEKLKTFWEIPVIDAGGNVKIAAKFYYENSKGIKRKEIVDADTGELTEKEYASDQKKPKLICADDLWVGTLEDLLNAEEAKNEGEKPTETKKNGEGSEKEKPEPVYMADIIEQWASEPVTDFAASVVYEFKELDFQPLVSLGDTVDQGEIPLSPQESSNKEAIELRMQNPQRASDQELMDDGGMSLADLEFDLKILNEGQSSFTGLEFDPNEGQSSFTDLDFDLQEGQGSSTSELELLDEIYTDLADQLKP